MEILEAGLDAMWRKNAPRYRLTASLDIGSEGRRGLPPPGFEDRPLFVRGMSNRLGRVLRKELMSLVPVDGAMVN
jgi:hypothetical protein